MNPVLIETNTEAIAEQKTLLNTTVVYLQTIYDKFKALNIELTIPELQNVIYFAGDGHAGMITELITDKVLEKAGEVSFGGVPVNRNKLKEFFDIPDIDSIVKWIIANPRSGSNLQSHAFRISFLSITDHVISKTNDAFTQIEIENTHYTKNDKGAELTTKLVTLATSLNAYATYLNEKNYYNAIAPLSTNDDRKSHIKGFKWENGTYKPDLDFIRRMEAAFPDYVA